MFPISIGAQIYFAERIDTLATNLIEARPTIMTAVPRLFEIDARAHPARVGPPGAGCRRGCSGTAVELGRKRYESPRSH